MNGGVVVASGRKRNKKKNTQNKEIEKVLEDFSCLPNDFSWFSLENLAVLERRVVKLLRKIYKILEKKLIEKQLADQLIKIQSTLSTRLLAIREKYVKCYADQYNCDWNEKDIAKLANSRSRKITISKHVYKKTVMDAIPTHPKDEYPLARAMRRHFVVHVGTTNTGKTYNALQPLLASANGVYLAPLRLLALEIYNVFLSNNLRASLITGEEEILGVNATHTASTVEKLNTEKIYDVVVIDEAQMLGDGERGYAWTRAVLGAAGEVIHVCCAPSALPVIEKLISECDDTYEIHKYVRDTKLIFEKKKFVFPENVQEGDALIAFSKKMVLNIASFLADEGIKVSVIYGALPPETRKKQIRLFLEGETTVIVSTDAIGMGVNLPIKRIVFMESTKYDGEERRKLIVPEVHQVAGRAGRKGIYDVGYVNAVNERDYIRNQLYRELPTISKAHYLPEMRFILSITIGSLQERLMTCIQLRANDGFRNADVSNNIMLLDVLNARETLTDEERLKLAFIPFDVRKIDVRTQWMKYVDLYVNNEEIPMPILQLSGLDSLELYYELLDLYYSFCKTMGLVFDSYEVSVLKQSTSEHINQILIEQINSVRSKCKYCGKTLGWNFPFKVCEACHSQRQY